jgi:hypothetical protein
MVYNIQNRWIYGLCPSSGILNTKNITFRKLDLFRSLGEWKETPPLLGPLESANLNHWTFLWDPTKYVFRFPQPEDGNTPSFRNDVFSSV